MMATTRSGFRYKIDKEALQDDWDFIELFGELEDKPNLMPRAVKKLLGDAQYKMLKEHCVKDGRVSGVMMSAEIEDIFQQLGEAEETKN